jgi:hypothetical protein
MSQGLESRVFDLEALAMGWYNYRAVFRYIMIATVTGFVLLMFVPPAPLYWFAIGHGFDFGPGGDYLILVAAYGCAFVMFGYFLNSELLGPVRLTVNSEGLRFQFKSGRGPMYRWADPHLRLELHDFRSRPDLIARIKPVYVCSIWGRVTMVSPLTPEAHDFVLATASALRMDVTKPYKFGLTNYTTDWYPGDAHRITRPS